MNTSTSPRSAAGPADAARQSVHNLPGTRERLAIPCQKPTNPAFALALISLLLAGCANQPGPDTTSGVDTAIPGEAAQELQETVERTFDLPPGSLEQPLPEETSARANQPDPCLAGSEPSGHWLDRAQRGLSWSVCGTARWFDGFFGDRNRYEPGVAGSYGRVNAFTLYDERTGIDQDFNFRSRFALPTLEQRARLIVGRGEERELIEERGTDDTPTLPERFDEVEDASWLLGLGLQKGEGLKRGFDTSFGIRLRNPPDPYSKLRYFHNWGLSDEALFRWRQTGFWTERRGFGTTTDLDLDLLLSDVLLLRWSNAGTLAEDRDGLDWSSSLNLFQSLSNRRALTYRTFIYGETGAPESLTSYGIELRYRQRILRKWLFLDLATGARWPKFSIDDLRESSLSVGIGLEMYFGPVPERELY